MREILLKISAAAGLRTGQGGGGWFHEHAAIVPSSVRGRPHRANEMTGAMLVIRRFPAESSAPPAPEDRRPTES
jgi:hypothetical protein